MNRRSLLLLLTLGFAQASYSQAQLHSHNDYVQSRHLEEALENKFQSVEVDVWLHRGKVQVSHTPWNFKGTLEELYLGPLQKMVDEKKLKAPLLLWIDLKALSPGIVPKLVELLKKYPMIGKEVRVVLTGRKKPKRELLEKYPELPVERDENSLDPNAPQNFTWYTLKWDEYTTWKGVGPLPAKELEKLKSLVEKIHSEGRRVRFYGSPGTEEYWKTLKDLKVDLIDTDNISELRKLWDSLPAPQVPEK